MNGDFSEVVAGSPVGWAVNRRNGSDPGLILAAGDGIARISPGTAVPGQWARLIQRIDAAPWRGKVVRLSARIRVASAGDHVGLRLNVVREGGRAGFYEQMNDAPLAEGDWRAVAITGVVDEDATAIEIGAMLGGRAAIEIDDVRFEELPPTEAPMAPEARAYLDRAIEFIRTTHMDSAAQDWPAIIARAHLQAGGAATPRDTWPAIRGVLGTMGDNHNFLRPPLPPTSPSGGAAAARPQPLPTYALLDGRFGLVALPGLSMLSEAERPHAQAYVQRLRMALLSFDRSPLCGWIVDLRGNRGGNMWPMLNGLTPLLGAPPFGAFVGHGSRANWVLRDGVATVENVSPRQLGLDIRGFALRQADAPVAVLIGPATGSSGEAVAIAFAGRPKSRSFGRRSAGYTSANMTLDLPDGAVLGVPASWEADRTGREYREAIEPDQATHEAEDLVAARNWLSTQCRPGTGSGRNE